MCGEGRVVGWVLAILLGMAGLLPQSAQTPKIASFLPSVSISLPPDILSETVQISYFLVGPFGGYGGYAAQRTGVHSYEIPTMLDGKAATEIRMIVGNGRVRHSWKSSNSKTFPSNMTGRMPKTSIWWAGKRRQVHGKRGGLNRSTQHSSRTRLTLKTKVKSLTRVDQRETLPWLGFDRGQPNRLLLPEKPCRIKVLDGVASTG